MTLLHSYCDDLNVWPRVRSECFRSHTEPITVVIICWASNFCGVWRQSEVIFFSVEFACYVSFECSNVWIRECMARCINMDEAKGVRSRWHSVGSAYPLGNKVWVYVCMNSVCLVHDSWNDPLVDYHSSFLTVRYDFYPVRMFLRY